MERPRRGPVWLGIDVACVLVFCAVGRRSHDEGLDVAGIATTAWPFLSGTMVGWLLSRAWRRPSALYPTGVAVWLCTVIVGMLLRKVTSAGVAGSFIVVAATVTGLLLLGWRAVAQLGRRSRLAERRA
jgi:peptidoglycan/LPS O-acetylase OafA/YrhL